MTVRSKLKSRYTSESVPSEKLGLSTTLDDFDPLIAVANRKAAMKPSWARARLAVLLGILVPLSIFGYSQNRQTTSRLRIQRALESWDNRTALREIRSLEKRTGLTAETAFLRCRAYRHLGEDVPFSLFADLAMQLGYPEEKIRNEKLLRDLFLGNVDNLQDSIARAMVAPDAELEEIGPAVVYGLLTKLDFPSVHLFLQSWSQENSNSPWIPFFQGMMSMVGRDTQSAIRSFESCVESHPNFIPVYGQLGAAYLRGKENEKVIGPIRHYLESVPEDLDAVSDLSNALLNLDRGDDVIEILSPAVESGKATSEMRTTLARLYQSRGEWSKVVDTLSSVAILWPEDVRIASLLSQAHQAIGNEQEAVRYAKIAEDGQPDIQSIDQRKSNILSGQDKTAEKHYELGHILIHKQSREEGLKWLSSALAIDPTYLPAHDDLILYFKRNNQPELAARHQRYVNRRRGTQ